MLSDDLAITWQIFGDFGSYLAKRKVRRQNRQKDATKTPNNNDIKKGKR